MHVWTWQMLPPSRCGRIVEVVVQEVPSPGEWIPISIALQRMWLFHFSSDTSGIMGLDAWTTRVPAITILTRTMIKILEVYYKVDLLVHSEDLIDTDTDGRNIAQVYKL